MTSSWFFLSTLNYDARSTTHQIYNVKRWRSGHYENYPELSTLPTVAKKKICVMVWSPSVDVNCISVWNPSAVAIAEETKRWRGPGLQPRTVAGNGAGLLHGTTPFHFEPAIYRSAQIAISLYNSPYSPKDSAFMLQANEICAHARMVPPMLLPTWPQLDRGTR